MILGDIDEAPLHELLDDLAHFSDMLGRARLHRRPQGCERIDVIVILLFGQLRDLADRLVERQTRKIARCPRLDLAGARGVDARSSGRATGNSVRSDGTGVGHCIGGELRTRTV